MRNYRMLRTACMLFAALLVAGLLPPPGQAQTGGDCRIFNETRQSVCGLFLRYWDTHGGLAQQGYPKSAPFVEQSEIDGQARTVQYFERAVFEYHPEHAGTPFEVELSLLGVQAYQRKYPNGAPNQRPNQDPGTRFFPQTQKRLGGSFRAYWESHGALAQQGYPISDEFIEISTLDNRPYTVQYFERAVFEWHPENTGTPYEVLLAQLGTYEHRRKYAAPPPPASPTPIPLPTATPTPSGPAGIGVRVPLAEGVTIALSNRSGMESNNCGTFMRWEFTIDNTTLNAFPVNVNRREVVQVDNNGQVYDPERQEPGSSCLGEEAGVGGVFSGDHRVLRHTTSQAWILIALSPDPPGPGAVTFDARLTVTGVALQFRHPIRPRP